MALFLKRVYEQPEESDGERILVDRLWPRGLAKDKAKVEVWLKDIAPSPELRKWYHKDLTKYEEFRERYRKELQEHPEKIQAVNEVIDKMDSKTVTFVYGAKNTEQNHAIVLKEFIEKIKGKGE